MNDAELVTVFEERPSLGHFDSARCRTGQMHLSAGGGAIGHPQVKLDLIANEDSEPDVTVGQLAQPESFPVEGNGTTFVRDG